MALFKQKEAQEESYEEEMDYVAPVLTPAAKKAMEEEKRAKEEENMRRIFSGDIDRKSVSQKSQQQMQPKRNPETKSQKPLDSQERQVRELNRKMQMEQKNPKPSENHERKESLKTDTQGFFSENVRERHVPKTDVETRTDPDGIVYESTYDMCKAHGVPISLYRKRREDGASLKEALTPIKDRTITNKSEAGQIVEKKEMSEETKREEKTESKCKGKEKIQIIHSPMPDADNEVLRGICNLPPRERGLENTTALKVIYLPINEIYAIKRKVNDALNNGYRIYQMEIMPEANTATPSLCVTLRKATELTDIETTENSIDMLRNIISDEIGNLKADSMIIQNVQFVNKVDFMYRNLVNESIIEGEFEALLEEGYKLLARKNIAATKDSPAQFFAIFFK